MIYNIYIYRNSLPSNAYIIIDYGIVSSAMKENKRVYIGLVFIDRHERYNIYYIIIVGSIIILSLNKSREW